MHNILYGWSSKLRSNLLVILFLTFMGCIEKKSEKIKKIEIIAVDLLSLYGGKIEIIEGANENSKNSNNSTLNIKLNNTKASDLFSNDLSIVTLNVASIVYDSVCSKSMNYENFNVLISSNNEVLLSKYYNNKELIPISENKKNIISFLDYLKKSDSTALEKKLKFVLKENNQILHKILQFEKNRNSFINYFIAGIKFDTTTKTISYFGAMTRRDNQKTKFTITFDLIKNDIIFFNYNWNF